MREAEAIPAPQEKKEATAAALGNLGAVYYQQGELDKARGHCEQALSLFRAIGAKREMAQAEQALAQVEKAKE